jgi:CRISPR/Cas system Type II protein with McrA/HNH and RuvC-like nuclease domain
VSFALSRLSPEEKKALRQRLWQRQNGVCFITQKAIDLLRDEVEIDHIVPTRDKGPDDESNWPLSSRERMKASRLLTSMSHEYSIAWNRFVKK